MLNTTKSKIASTNLPGHSQSVSCGTGRSRHNLDRAISDIDADEIGVRVTEYYHGGEDGASIQKRGLDEVLDCTPSDKLFFGLLITIGLAVSTVIGVLLCGWSTRRSRYIGSRTCEDGMSTRTRGPVVDRIWPMVPSYSVLLLLIHRPSIFIFTVYPGVQCYTEYS